MRPRKPNKQALLFIFITVLLDIIGFGIIIPVMPDFIMELTGEGRSQAAVYGGLVLFGLGFLGFNKLLKTRV